MFSKAKYALSALVIAALVTTAGCSRDDGGGDSPGTTAASPAPATTPELESQKRTETGSRSLQSVDVEGIDWLNTPLNDWSRCHYNGTLSPANGETEINVHERSNQDGEDVPGPIKVSLVPEGEDISSWTVQGIDYGIVPFRCESIEDGTQRDQGYAVVGKNEAGDLVVAGNITAGDAASEYDNNKTSGLATITFASFPDDRIEAREEQHDPSHLGTSISTWAVQNGQVIRQNFQVVSRNVPPPRYDNDPPDTKRSISGLAVFKSPAGNIHCQIRQDSVLCWSDESQWQAQVPDPQKNCMMPSPGGNFSNMLSLGVAGPSVPCQSGGVDLSANEETASWSDTWDGSTKSVPVLGYGESLTVNDITCSVETSGVTCVNSAGSFMISKFEYKLNDLN